MYKKAAAIIREAEVFIVTAGAGMGVDSGLPDFRGNKGFWNAYPAYESLGLSFEECANPMHFAMNPEFGWGFYGHRTNLYERQFLTKVFRSSRSGLRGMMPTILSLRPMLMVSFRKPDMPKTGSMRFTVPFTGSSVRRDALKPSGKMMPVSP